MCSLLSCASAKRSITRRTKFELNQARDRAHVLVGLAIAVANIDEVIHLIRTSPDPATARERLLARRWPAKDMAPLVALVADPRHQIAGDGTITLSDEQAHAILDLRLAALDRARRRRNRRRAQGPCRQDHRLSGYLAQPRARLRDHQKRAESRSRKSSQRRAGPKSSISRARSMTKT